MSNPVNQTQEIESKIEGKLDMVIAGETQVSSRSGGIAFADMSQVMEFAKLMAISRQAVPKHLRSQPGMCLALTLQALNWRMDPFAVANKSYAVNDRLAYEAQLVQAVIEQRAPIKGRIKGKLLGDGADRQWHLWAISEDDGEKVEYTSPKISEITTKNSPLWKSDPDQQLWYYSARAFCRRHFPDVLLGVYEKEEIESSPAMKDVTPVDGPNLAQQLEAAARDAEDAPESPQDADRVQYDENAVDPFDEAYGAGQDAFRSGELMVRNPYNRNPEYSSFVAGWNFENDQADE